MMAQVRLTSLNSRTFVDEDRLPLLLVFWYWSGSIRRYYERPENNASRAEGEAKPWWHCLSPKTSHDQATFTLGLFFYVNQYILFLLKPVWLHFLFECYQVLIATIHRVIFLPEVFLLHLNFVITFLFYLLSQFHTAWYHNFL